MCAASAPESAQAPPRVRVALSYALDGDLRYLSHHDEMRMLTRALVRARWPLRYSQGFNPIPRLALPLPRSVGTASECQLALVELREERAAHELKDSLAATLPADCRLTGLNAPASSGKPHAIGVEYRVALDPADARTAASRLQPLLHRGAVTVQRDDGAGRPPRTLDIRPFIETLALDGSVLRMRLKIQQQRTARPSEILKELGLPADAGDNRVRRTEVIWDMELSGLRADPAAPKGTYLGDPEEISKQEKGEEAPA